MEQRQHVRKILDSSARLADPSGKSWGEVSLKDISIGGAAFVTAERVIVDTVRAFKFLLPDNAEEFQASVKILNRTQTPTGFRVGVTFLQIDAKALAAIRRYVEADTAESA